MVEHGPSSSAARRLRFRNPIPCLVRLAYSLAQLFRVQWPQGYLPTQIQAMGRTRIFDWLRMSRRGALIVASAAHGVAQDVSWPSPKQTVTIGSYGCNKRPTSRDAALDHRFDGPASLTGPFETFVIHDCREQSGHSAVHRVPEFRLVIRLGAEVPNARRYARRPVAKASRGRIGTAILRCSTFGRFQNDLTSH